MTTIQSPGVFLPNYATKNTQFQMLRETAVFNSETQNFVSWWPCAGYSGSRGVVGKILKRYKLKDRTETKKRSIFQGFGGKFPNLRLNGQNIFPFHHSDSKYLSPV